MKKEILVVDDQPGIRLLLHDMLTNAGYQITTANTGKEALDQINEKNFDLIILDYKLPIINGVQVLKQLETDQISIPAIIISGMSEDVRRESLEYSMVKEVLAKPFNVEDVCGIVKSLLE